MQSLLHGFVLQLLCSTRTEWQTKQKQLLITHRIVAKQQHLMDLTSSVVSVVFGTEVALQHEVVEHRSRDLTAMLGNINVTYSGMSSKLKDKLGN